VAQTPSEFQQLISGLAADLSPKIDRLTQRLGTLTQSEVLAFVTDAYPELITPYMSLAADTTADWYEDLPAKLDTPAFAAAPAELLPEEQLAASARWAMLENDPATALKGTATRSVFRSQRDTVMVNANREGVRWARHASATACGFCRMLATRGAAYRKQALALRSHDGCHCVAVPNRDGRFEPMPYVEQWQADYSAARSDGHRTPKAIAQAMERAGAERVRQAAAQAAELKRQQDISVWLDAEDDYAHSLAYWRRVDAEDLHSIPAADLAEPAPPAVSESALDKAVRELEEAIDSGDDDRIEAAAAAVERAEQAELKAAAAEERKAAKANADADRIVALIDEEGWDPAEAEAEVTGKSVEAIRRRDFIAQARADGHEGNGFDELLASVFNERVAEMAIAAENATNGYMVKKQYELTVNPKQLWSVNDTTARKWMTEEMAAWFDENGRLTRPILRQMVLRGEYSIRKFNQSSQDYLQ
jgi:hypothetical protein